MTISERRTIRRTLWAGLAGVMLLAACGDSSGPTDRIIALINGHEIHESRFRSFYQLRAADESEADLPLLREALYRDFLVHQLLLQEAGKAGIEISDLQVEAELNRWLAGTETEMSQDWAGSAREILLIQNLVQDRVKPLSLVTPEEVSRYYEENPEEFVVEDRVHIREILVNSRRLAEEIRSRLRGGTIEDFAREAAAHSLGATAAEGGDLGTFERGELPEEFEKVVFSLLPGAISEVFESSHGFHIFMVEELVRRHPQKLAQVVALIFERLAGERERLVLENYVNHLLQSASMEIYDEEFQSAWRDINASLAP